MNTPCPPNQQGGLGRTEKWRENVVDHHHFTPHRKSSSQIIIIIIDVHIVLNHLPLHMGCFAPARLREPCHLPVFPQGHF